MVLFGTSFEECLTVKETYWSIGTCPLPCPQRSSRSVSRSTDLHTAPPHRDCSPDTGPHNQGLPASQWWGRPPM